jgi:hypothetical protein
MLSPTSLFCLWLLAYSCGKNMRYCCDAYHLDCFKNKQRLYTFHSHYGNVNGVMKSQVNAFSAVTGNPCKQVSSLN